MDELVEIGMRAIAQADERNGGAPYEHRITFGKHAKEQLRDEAVEFLRAIESSGKYRVVPVIATDVMIMAGATARPASTHLNTITAMSVWEAMLTASPKVTGNE